MVMPAKVAGELVNILLGNVVAVAIAAGPNTICAPEPTVNVPLVLAKGVKVLF